MTERAGRLWRTLSFLQLIVVILATWEAYQWRETAWNAIEAAHVSQAIARQCIGTMQDEYRAPDPLVIGPEHAPMKRRAD